LNNPQNKYKGLAGRAFLSWILIIFIVIVLFLQTINFQSDLQPTQKAIQQQDEDLQGELLIDSNAHTPTHSTRARYLDIWGMSDLELIEAHNPNQNTVYAQYYAYTFQFTIDPLFKFDNVTSVSLELSDEGLSNTWHKSRNDNGGSETDENAFSRSSERTGSISSSFDKISIDTAFLEFSITFGWSKSYTDQNHLFNITIFDNESNTSKFTDILIYNVVRDVKFTGQLKAEGEFQGELAENDWVRAKEKITWTGLSIVYNSSANFKLPESEGKIVLYDDDGDNWEDISGPLEDMRIVSSSDIKNDLMDTHFFKLAGNAELNLDKTYNFNVRVDGDGIEFYNPRPKSGVWQNSTHVECRISISDNDTSGVDSDSIEFSFSTDNGQVWNDWLKPDINNIDEPKVIECYKTVTKFIETEVNLIKWRGRDLVGNPLISSEPYNIPIDLSDLKFKNEKPIKGELLYSVHVECSVDIEDTTSGVNASSIQYSAKKDGDSNWSQWYNLSPMITKSEKFITPEIILNFNYGKDNYIKWRAKDVAGNGYKESEAYQILVTHKVPKIFLESPVPDTLINTTKPTLYWNTSYAVLQPVTYYLEYWLEGNLDDITQVELSTLRYTFEDPLKFDTKYYWRVTPEASSGIGISESGTWNFTINSIGYIYPVFKVDFIISPETSITHKPDEQSNFVIIIYNQGNRDDVFEINIITDDIWDGYIIYPHNVSIPINGSSVNNIKVTTPDLGLINNSYQLKISITSNGAKEFELNISKVDFFTILKFEEEPKAQYEFGLLEIFIIVLVIIIVWAVFIGIRLRKKPETKPPKLDLKTIPPKKGDVDIVFQPDRKKAVDRSSKSDLIQKPKV
jgi:hypothetical protein